ncbi:unnamed protein product [Trichobilharzia szidati]|nr:unnamed protein product [Trichobilharzia szidati]
MYRYSHSLTQLQIVQILLESILMFCKLYIISISLYAFMSVCAVENADIANFKHTSVPLNGPSDNHEVVAPIIKDTGDLSGEEDKEFADKLGKIIDGALEKENAKLKEAFQQTLSELKEEQEKSTNYASDYGIDLVLQGISVVIVTLTCFSGMFQ